MSDRDTTPVDKLSLTYVISKIKQLFARSEDLGDLTELPTTDKSSAVAAISELNENKVEKIALGDGTETYQTIIESAFQNFPNGKPITGTMNSITTRFRFDGYRNGYYGCVIVQTYGGDTLAFGYNTNGTWTWRNIVRELNGTSGNVRWGKHENIITISGTVTWTSGTTNTIISNASALQSYKGYAVPCNVRRVQDGKLGQGYLEFDGSNVKLSMYLGTFTPSTNDNISFAASYMAKV